MCQISKAWHQLQADPASPDWYGPWSSYETRCLLLLWQLSESATCPLTHEWVTCRATEHRQRVALNNDSRILLILIRHISPACSCNRSILEPSVKILQSTSRYITQFCETHRRKKNLHHLLVIKHWALVQSLWDYKWMMWHIIHCGLDIQLEWLHRHKIAEVYQDTVTDMVNFICYWAPSLTQLEA